MTTNKKAASDKTYILTLKDGNIRKITIPASWKLTFGQLVPHSGPRSGGSHGVALRMYEGSKDNLRAVMCDVVAFRDAGISIMERRTTVQRKAAQKASQQGMRDVVVEARVTEWVNPDAEVDTPVPSEYLSLPGGSEDRDEEEDGSLSF